MPRRGAFRVVLAVLAAIGGCRAISDHCRVDSVRGCECVLGSDLYKDTEGCDSNACAAPGGVDRFVHLIDGCSAKVRQAKMHCEEMQNVVRCAKELGCFDRNIEDVCTGMVRSDPTCELDCAAAFRAAGVGLTAVLMGLFTMSLHLQA
ncbi:unnamed protein product [Prorocentrum cordatum]|uniref:Uncharacterized protein n=1 Tax=Prorocentrum cordatum TaxID=2364126 RepID=A0ABN9YF69_9DINO|nr:unnamed protein product [Polarella glacialis]